MTDASKNVAFIGIGKMGLPMSALIAKAGGPLRLTHVDDLLSVSGEAGLGVVEAVAHDGLRVGAVGVGHRDHLAAG